MSGPLLTTPLHFSQQPDEEDMRNFQKAILVFSVIAAFGIESSASDQPAKWNGWNLRIDGRQCRLNNMYTSGTSKRPQHLGFLTGTPFETAMFHIYARTNARDASRYVIGQTHFGVKVFGSGKIAADDQAATLEIGGYRKEADKLEERLESNETAQAFSGFWFYGAEADDLLYRLAQGEPVRMVFKNARGETLINTEYVSRVKDRLPAWAEAFRACMVANLE